MPPKLQNINLKSYNIVGSFVHGKSLNNRRSKRLWWNPQLLYPRKKKFLPILRREALREYYAIG